MKDNLNTSLLLDFYGNLLTEKQRDALDMHYNMDLSLGEIAENIGVTRQCVRDFIKKGEERLLNFEENIGMCSYVTLVEIEAENIKKATENIDEEIKEKINKSLSAIVGSMEL